MQIYYFRCKDCRYEIRMPLGSSDLDQILTDTNTDYADYHLFVCHKESKFVHADIHDKTFEGKCASDGSELEEVKAMQSLNCPTCKSRGLITVVTDPLEDNNTGSESA